MSRLYVHSVPVRDRAVILDWNECRFQHGNATVNKALIDVLSAIVLITVVMPSEAVPKHGCVLEQPQLFIIPLRFNTPPLWGGDFLLFIIRVICGP
jgi:hypothetical protein